MNNVYLAKGCGVYSVATRKQLSAEPINRRLLLYIDSSICPPSPAPLQHGFDLEAMSLNIFYAKYGSAEASYKHIIIMTFVSRKFQHIDEYKQIIQPTKSKQCETRRRPTKKEWETDEKLWVKAGHDHLSVTNKTIFNICINLHEKHF